VTHQPIESGERRVSVPEAHRTRTTTDPTMGRNPLQTSAARKRYRKNAMIFALTSDLFDAWQALERGNGAPSARDRLDYSSKHTYGRPDVASGTAQVTVAGVLTKHPDLFAMLIGGANTTYTDIARSLDVAESDSS